MGMNYSHPYARLTKPLAKGVAKDYFLVPSTSGSVINNLQDLFPIDGDATTRVFTDTATAIAAMTASVGDTLWVHPGTYTLTAAVSLATADIRIIGLGSPGTCIFAGSGANIFNITASGIELANLQLQLATTKKCISMVGVSGCNIHDNVFTSAVGGAASHFIHMLTTACNYNWIHDNRFLSNLDVSGAGVTQTSHITGLGIGNVIEHNFFMAGRLTTANAGVVTDGVVFAAAADAGNSVRWNSFTEFNGATFTAGVETGASTVSGAALIVDNNFLLATAGNAVVNTAGSAGFANNIANGTV